MDDQSRCGGVFVDCSLTRHCARTERGHGLFADTDNARLRPVPGLFAFAALPRLWS